jgi:hypothetical protein
VMMTGGRGLNFSDYQVVSIKNTVLFSRAMYSEMSRPTFWEDRDAATKGIFIE